MSRDVVDRLVEVGALQEVVADDPLLGLRVRTVGHEHLAVADTNGGGVVDRPEGVAAEADAATVAFLHPTLDLAVGLLWRSWLRVGGDEQQVLHGSSSARR